MKIKRFLVCLVLILTFCSSSVELCNLYNSTSVVSAKQSFKSYKKKIYKKYKKVKVGMTYKQVKKIFGKSGEVYQDLGHFKNREWEFEYRNEDGDYYIISICIGFEKGRVEDKQFTYI